MIPPLNELGYLPPGIHQAGLPEVLELFGHGSDQRVAIAESLRWLIPLCIRAGITRVMINGSFTTSVAEPNDADCALLQGPAYRSDSADAMALRNELPFLDLHVLDEEDYNFLADAVFGTDRNGVSKGIIEVRL